ncbi:phosphotransferase [Actinacidiphila sp. bgisy167]|uniref:phosphotransferase n=1 Tax=Actinacidiphila sp. bgisy167 TaxID=3413797 RepID=UPI003D752867
MPLIAGIPASGKSTVAQAPAERLHRSAHVRGDGSRRMIVGGRAETLPGDGSGDLAALTGEALRQLRLRHSLAVSSADAYAAVRVRPRPAGRHPQVTNRRTPSPCCAPAPAHRAPRALAGGDHRPRGGTGRDGRARRTYGAWTPVDLDRALRAGTPRIGLWLRISLQTPQEVVDAILRHAGPTR